MKDRLARRLVALVGLGSVVLVLAAVVLQHGFDMQPCSWCVLQRLIYLVIAVVCLAALWLPPAAARGALVIGIALALCGAAAALWQHFVAARSESCMLTLADKIVKGPGLDEWLPWLFKATAFCNEANLPLAGVPFAIWSLAAYVLGAALLVRALTR